MNQSFITTTCTCISGGQIGSRSQLQQTTTFPLCKLCVHNHCSHYVILVLRIVYAMYKNYSLYIPKKLHSAKISGITQFKSVLYYVADTILHTFCQELLCAFTAVGTNTLLTKSQNGLKWLLIATMCAISDSMVYRVILKHIQLVQLVDQPVNWLVAISTCTCLFWKSGLLFSTLYTSQLYIYVSLMCV